MSSNLSFTLPSMSVADLSALGSGSVFSLLENEKSEVEAKTEEPAAKAHDAEVVKKADVKSSAGKKKQN